MKSCLQPFLVRELSNSYTSMGERMPFFEEVFRLVQRVLDALPKHAPSILEAVRPHFFALKASAETFRSTLGSSAEQGELAADVDFARLAELTAERFEACSAHAFDSSSSSAAQPSLEVGIPLPSFLAGKIQSNVR